MKIRLVVTVPLSEDETKTYDYVFQQEEITVGRKAGSDITIPTPSVAESHAKIISRGDGFAVVDLGSEAGTTIDGQAVAPNEPTEIPDGCEIGIGPCSARVSIEAGELTSAVQEKTQQVAMQMVREVLGALGGGGPCPHLEIINDEEQGQTAELPDIGSEVVLGRDKSCELPLTHWSVSRRHARIFRTADGVKVEDLGSKNGVMLNEEVLTAPVKLRDGDIVFVGHTQVKFMDPGDTLTDQLIDLPDPVALDMKTSVIDLGDKKSTTGPVTEKPRKAKPKPEKTESQDATGEVKPEKKPAPPKPKPAPAAQDAAPSMETSQALEDLDGGGGDWLFVIIGIIVILGAIGAGVCTSITLRSSAFPSSGWT